MTSPLELLTPNPVTMRNVLGRFCTGVAVITGHDGTRPFGFTCQSVTSVSLEPPYVSFCPASSSSSWPSIRDTGRLAINVLAHDQRDLCVQFAQRGGEKFGGIDWFLGDNGCPAFDGSLAVIEADLEYEHSAGDHTIVVVHVTGLRLHPDRKPLLFFRGGFGGLAMSDS
ncbi:monooxygenase [Mycobacterium sp. ITM-2017-0098]|nr:monooxygenase [Mycobacterium sp. ITM-2017-0098]